MGSGTGLCHLENFRLYQKISQIRTKRETGKFLKIILKTSFLFHNKNKKNFTITKFLIPVFVHKSNILPASRPDRQKFVRLLWNGRKTRHTLLQNPGLGLIFQLQKSNLFKLFLKKNNHVNVSDIYYSVLSFGCLFCYPFMYKVSLKSSSKKRICTVNKSKFLRYFFLLSEWTNLRRMIP